MSANIPKYELLADHFFEPEVVGKGSIIEYDGEPNHNMRPLNKEAEEALERWFSAELPVLDEKTGKHVRNAKDEPQFHQPRHELRPVEQRAPAKAAGIRVVSGPPAVELKGKQLADLANAPAKEWERPEPAHNPTGVRVTEAKPPLEGNTTKGPA
jgi:hypothetical protein